MSSEVLVKEHIFMQDEFFPQCHASTLIVLENDEILSAWFGGTHEKHKDVAIWIARRKGNKWSEPVKIADEEGVPCWNPVLFSPDKRKVYLFYKVGETIISWYTMIKISEDGGYTWSESRELVKGDVGGRGPVKNKVIKLSNGTWLSPASIETNTAWDAFVDISYDSGETWCKSSLVPLDHNKIMGKGVIQPTLWESIPGKVHMFLRSTDGYIYRSNSEDGGITWCPAYPTVLPNNNSGIDAVSVNQGLLALVYNPVKGNWAERTPIIYGLSRDNGLNWEEEFVLDHNDLPASREDGEFSYPAIVADNNKLYITYTWKRKTIAFWKIHVD